MMHVQMFICKYVTGTNNVATNPVKVETLRGHYHPMYQGSQ
jgi:hypothetical protein